MLINGYELQESGRLTVYTLIGSSDLRNTGDY